MIEKDYCFYSSFNIQPKYNSELIIRRKEKDWEEKEELIGRDEGKRVYFLQFSHNEHDDAQNAGCNGVRGKVGTTYTE